MVTARHRRLPTCRVHLLPLLALLLAPTPTHDYRRYRDAMRWQADALNAAFVAQLAAGVYPDGVETEMASGYDMVTAGDFYTTLQVLSDGGDRPPPPAFRHPDTPSPKRRTQD